MNEFKILSFNKIIINSIIAVIIAIMAATFVILNVGPLFVGWAGLFLVFLFCFLWRLDMKYLKTAKSTGIRLITFVVGSLMLGAFFGNALYVTVIYTSMYAEVGLFISNALIFAAFGTVVATTGGVLLARKIASKHNLGVPQKLVRAIFITLIGYSIVSSIAIVLALLGWDTLWMFIIGLVFGLGPISVLISVLMTTFAAYMLVAIIAGVYSVCEESKTVPYQDIESLELFYGIVIANSIVDLFVELFRLALKLFAIGSK